LSDTVVILPLAVGRETIMRPPEFLIIPAGTLAGRTSAKTVENVAPARIAWRARRPRIVR
jgi:hypothetical protein